MSCQNCTPNCKKQVKIGKMVYCGDCPPRCGLHQIVKSQGISIDHPSWKRCIFCQYYTNNLDSKKCHECLSTSNLIHFETDRWVKETPQYQYMVSHDPEEG